MLKKIKSWMAASAHMDAIALWENFQRADALNSISQAIKLETNEAILAKHLAFKADIQVVLGKQIEAMENYKKAYKLIKANPEFWSKTHNIETANKVIEMVNTNA